MRNQARPVNFLSLQAALLAIAGTPLLFLALFLALFFALLLGGCGQVSVPSSAESASPAQNARSTTTTNHSDLRYDLEADERRGGHTVKKHVGRTDAELRERLDRERDISAASTWTDLKAAEETVGDALQADRSRIAQWEERGYRRPNLALHFNEGRVIGRSMYRGSEQSEPVTHAVIVLRANGPGFFVLTAYPEER